MGLTARDGRALQQLAAAKGKALKLDSIRGAGLATVKKLVSRGLAERTSSETPGAPAWRITREGSMFMEKLRKQFKAPRRTS